MSPREPSRFTDERNSTTPDYLTEQLNRVIQETPALRSLFPQTRMPRYRYYALKRKDSGGRWDRWYAWTTERAQGVGGKGSGFFAVEYARHGNEGRIVRSVRFARRSVAKARAYQWYTVAKLRAKDPDGTETYGVRQRDGAAEDDPPSTPSSDPEDPTKVAIDPEDP